MSDAGRRRMANCIHSNAVLRSCRDEQAYGGETAESETISMHGEVAEQVLREEVISPVRLLQKE